MVGRVGGHLEIKDRSEFTYLSALYNPLSKYINETHLASLSHTYAKKMILFLFRINSFLVLKQSLTSRISALLIFVAFLFYFASLFLKQNRFS